MTPNSHDEKTADLEARRPEPDLDQSDSAWLRDAADLQVAFNEIGVLKLAKAGMSLAVGVDGHTGFWARVPKCGRRFGHSGRTAGRAIRAAYQWHYGRSQ